MISRNTSKFVTANLERLAKNKLEAFKRNLVADERCYWCYLNIEEYLDARPVPIYDVIGM